MFTSETDRKGAFSSPVSRLKNMNSPEILKCVPEKRYIGVGEIALKVLAYSGEYPLATSTAGFMPTSNPLPMTRIAPPDNSAPEEPVKTTLCDIVHSPLQFNGKTVQFRTGISLLERDRRSIVFDPQGNCFARVFFASEAATAAYLNREFFAAERRIVEAANNCRGYCDPQRRYLLPDDLEDRFRFS
jgi:hypothetical protein